MHDNQRDEEGFVHTNSSTVYQSQTSGIDYIFLHFYMQVDIFKYYLLNTLWSQFNLTEENICFYLDMLYTFINEV